tara:strand:- start:65 stop:754 length:690 start_codon:yes stop_codon:yes gene_type:complete
MGLKIKNSKNIVTDGLVLNLDASDSISNPGNGSTWYDRSGQGSNGTLVNGIVFNSANGGVLSCDGSNDHVSLSLSKTAECSFSCWAKSSETSVSAISDMLFNASSDGDGPDLFFTGSTISWNTWDSAANLFCITPSLVADGNYHQYFVVCDATTEIATLYIDGVSYGTADHTAARHQSKLTSSNNMYIGGTNGGYQWKGNIGEFKMYNKKLTVAEINQNYNATKSRFGL